MRCDVESIVRCVEVVLVWPIVKLMIISKDFYSHDKCLHMTYVHAPTHTHDLRARTNTHTQRMWSYS